MDRRVSVRVGFEAIAGTASAALLAATQVWPDWIERSVGLAPDHGDGSTEWGWAIAFGLVALGCFADAGRVWRRGAPASDPPQVRS